MAQRPCGRLHPGPDALCGLLDRGEEALLSEVVGAAVREECAKGARPRCCFRILTDGRGAA